MRSRLSRILTVVAVTFAFAAVSAGAASAADKEFKNPAKDSVHAALIAGLKLLKAEKFDKWIDGSCHKEQLCYNANSIKSLKRYNLPAIFRLLTKKSPSCLRGNDDTIVVTRSDTQPDGTEKIFVKCLDDGMPRPFYLAKEGGAWKFTKI